MKRKRKAEPFESHRDAPRACRASRLTPAQAEALRAVLRARGISYREYGGGAEIECRATFRQWSECIVAAWGKQGHPRCPGTGTPARTVAGTTRVLCPVCDTGLKPAGGVTRLHAGCTARCTGCGSTAPMVRRNDEGVPVYACRCGEAWSPIGPRDQAALARVAAWW